MKAKSILLRILLVISCFIAFSGLSTVYADSPAKVAYLVVRFSDSDSIVRPVTFSGTISAHEALELSGLIYTTADSGYGSFLCSIAEVGDSTAACDNGDRYWATYEWDGTQWVARAVGIDDAMLDDGDVEGFSWSDPGWAVIDPPSATPMVSAQHAIDWLLLQKQDDGGYSAPGSTAEVLMALGANRQAPESGTIANMLGNGFTLASDAAGAGKLALGLSPHGTCWPIDAKQPLDYYDGGTGSFYPGAGSQALAMLGTAALGQAIPGAAVAYLVGLQQVDGGWEWEPAWGSDTNSTALALQALVAAGEDLASAAIVDGIAYLEAAQNDDGGFPYSPTSLWGTDSDTNSTAYVLQALYAVGEDPLAGTWVTGTPANPVDYLLDMQLSDGSFEWQPGEGANQFATQQAIPALLGRAFPIQASAVPSCIPTYLTVLGRSH